MSDDPLETCEKCGGRLQQGPAPGRHPLQGLGLLHDRLRQGLRQASAGAARRRRELVGGLRRGKSAESGADSERRRQGARTSRRGKSGSDGAKPKEKQKAT